MKQTYKIGNIEIGKGMPKVCAPLTGKTAQELLEECALIRDSAADLAEWRVDHFESALDNEVVLQTLPEIRKALGEMPLIFSFRTAEEGGELEISLNEYITLNRKVAESGHVNMIDIELFKGEAVVKELVAVARRNRVFTIISNHDFNGTPKLSELVHRMEQAIKFEADFPKLAVMPKKEEDVLTLLQASLHLKRTYPDNPLIMIAMGEMGLITRFSGELFGSSITFASVKNSSAPGQVAADKLKGIIQLLHLSH